MMIDTDDVTVGNTVMAQLGIGPGSFTIERIKGPLRDPLAATKSRSVRINETSETTEQIEVQFLDDNKVVGIDWFSQRDCVSLFRLISGWMDFSLPHLKLKESITRRILHR